MSVARRVGLLAGLGLLVVAGCVGPFPDTRADVVYTSARIFTVDAQRPWAEALAIKDGKLVLVGSNDDVMAVTGAGTEIRDMGGRTILPGLVDRSGSAGSDLASSVPDANAFEQIQAWITRHDPPIPLRQAISEFTLGSLEKGKAADFIVLDRDPFELPLEELHSTRITRTVLGGRIVRENRAMAIKAGAGPPPR